MAGETASEGMVLVGFLWEQGDHEDWMPGLRPGMEPGWGTSMQVKSALTLRAR